MATELLASRLLLPFDPPMEEEEEEEENRLRSKTEEKETIPPNPAHHQCSVSQNSGTG